MAASTARKRRRNLPSNPELAPPKTGFAFFLRKAVEALLCLSDLPWVLCGQRRLAEANAVGDQNPVLVSPAVARLVADLTGANDQVFVAGSEPLPVMLIKFQPVAIRKHLSSDDSWPLAAGYQAAERFATLSKTLPL